MLQSDWLHQSPSVAARLLMSKCGKNKKVADEVQLIVSLMFLIHHDFLNTKKSVSRIGSEVQTFLEGEENQYTKRKTESYVFSGFDVSISRLRMKIDNWKICHRPIWPFT